MSVHSHSIRRFFLFFPTPLIASDFEIALSSNERQISNHASSAHLRCLVTLTPLPLARTDNHARRRTPLPQHRRRAHARRVDVQHREDHLPAQLVHLLFVLPPALPPPSPPPSPLRPRPYHHLHRRLHPAHRPLSFSLPLPQLHSPPAHCLRYANPYHTPIYVAKEQGWLKEEGALTSRPCAASPMSPRSPPRQARPSLTPHTCMTCMHALPRPYPPTLTLTSSQPSPSNPSEPSPSLLYFPSSSSSRHPDPCILHPTLHRTLHRTHSSTPPPPRLPTTHSSPGQASTWPSSRPPTLRT